MNSLSHEQVEESLSKAIKESNPAAKLEKEIRTSIDSIVDMVLTLPFKRIAFEIKMSNFYNALGRIILWYKEFDAVFLVIPDHIIPSKKILSLLPSKIGIISFEIDNRTLRFEIVRNSIGYKIQRLSSQVVMEVLKETKPVKTSLVSPKSLRVIRYLVSHKSSTQTQISRETKVSIGMVHKVVSTLMDSELISYKGKNLVVHDIWQLLNAVSWNRSIKKLKKAEIQIKFKSIEDAEIELVNICNEMNTKYALTLFSGATKYIGYGMKYDSVQVYSDSPIELSQVLRKMRSSIDGGIFIEIFAIDNLEIINEARKVDSFVVCSPTQLLLDLISYGGVGKDWAVKLYESTISKKE